MALGSLPRSLRHWHRRIGIVVAIVLILVSATGIALNHVTGLRLDNIMISSPAVLALYDIPQVTDQSPTHQAGNHYVTSVGNRLFVDSTPVLNKTGAIVGAATTGQFLAATEASRLHLLLPDGQFVETISLSQIGAPVTGLSSDGERFVAFTATGTFRSNAELSRWEESDLPTASGIPARLPTSIQTEINHHLRGDGLPLYRIILDLHSGRILGRVGPWLMDIAGILTIVLSLTGLWMWLGRRR